MSEGQAYDWDQRVDKPNEDGEFTILPPGEYAFECVKMERARHEGSANLPPCNKAVVYLKFNGGDLGTTTLKNNLFLHSKCDGLLCQFFLAIGHRKHGEVLQMDWARVVGSRGVAKLKIRNYRKKGDAQDRQINDINRFLDQPAAAPPPAQSQATEPVFDDNGDTIPF